MFQMSQPLPLLFHVNFTGRHVTQLEESSITHTRLTWPVTIEREREVCARLCVCLRSQVIVFTHHISVDTVNSIPVHNKTDMCFVYELISKV